MQIVLLIVILLLLIYDFYLMACPFYKTGWGVFVHFYPWLKYFLPTAFLIFSMALFQLPLFIFYILGYFSKALYIRSVSGSRSWKNALANTGFLTPAATHLIAVGFIAFAAQCSISEVLMSSGHRTLSLIFLLLGDIYMGHSLIRNQNRITALNAGSNNEDFLSLSRFLWFCSVYVLIESLFCPFDPLLLYTPLFLIGGNVLLLYLVSSYYRNIYLIMESYDAAAENIVLKNEMELLYQSTDTLRRSMDFDNLTGIYSRTCALTQLQDMLDEAHPFSLVFIDLDQLKKVNDKYGHTAGDTYLCRFTSEFKRHLRKDDLFARFGGDEFLLLLPDCDKERAGQRMQSIRLQLAGTDARPSFPFSFGVVSFSPESPANVQELLNAADQAMYTDKKRSGKQIGGHL